MKNHTHLLCLSAMITAILVMSSMFTSSQAQRLDYVQGEFLVQMADSRSASSFVDRWNGNSREGMRIDQVKAVLPDLGIYKVTFDYTRVHEQRLMRKLEGDEKVLLIQHNHIIHKRRTPNDPEFAIQWQYINDGSRPGSVADADLDADLAWDITTGGVTALGDSIVVCVIDDGLNPMQEDVLANLWINHAEIPDNNVDDDNNGYLDDYYGWDTWGDDGDTPDGNPLTTSPQDNHGTPVAGIVGAKGNNGIGVTGVNWDVKLMIVRGGDGRESNVLASYGYPLAMRRRYNQTNGAEGAFVVATNASWGVDGGQPSDAPLWCALYDELGQEGILNACATTNAEANVDVIGDLPTACPSEYVLAVTNMRHSGQRNQPSGFGSMHVDLGAFGSDTYTTAVPNNYDEFGGTSGASPHVAGAIALLYSLQCENIAQLALDQPHEAAALVREAIFESVKPNSSLEGITRYEGVLNLNNALNELLVSCGACSKPFSVIVDAIDVSSARVSFVNVATDGEVEIDYRPIGTTSWTTISTDQNTVLLMDLDACETYELRTRTACDTTQSTYTEVTTFKTDGCCDAPLSLELVDVDDRTAIVGIPSVTAATGYSGTLTLQPDGTAMPVNTLNTTLQLTGLTPCSEYELELRTTCGDSSSVEVGTLIFETRGCGSCLDVDYCSPPEGDTQYEFIDMVGIEDVFVQTSGDDDGYGDYTGLANAVVEQGRDYNFLFKAGAPTTVSLEDLLRVWLDWDQDGVFDDAEIVIEVAINDDSEMSIPMTVPVDAALGTTRMRVGLRFNDAPNDCGDSFEILGEYEDYCLQVDRQSNVIDNPTNNNNTGYSLYPNPVVNQLHLGVEGQADLDVRLRVYDGQGRLVMNPTLSLSESGDRSFGFDHLSAGMYLVSLVDGQGRQVYVQRVIKL